MKEKIHIGELIQEKLDENGQSVTWLAKKVYCDPSNFTKSLNKSYIDTDLLLLISKAMRIDFFKYYSDLLSHEIGFLFEHKGISELRKAAHAKVPFMKERIHIGELIKEKLDENRQAISWLAKKVYCDPSNFNQSLKNNQIDTELLLLISKTMHIDFFKYYSDLLRHDNIVG